MNLVRRRLATRGEDGVSLVLALVFILIVGLFCTVALTKAQNTLIAGENLRDRGQLQYELDGGVDRALQVVRSEMTTTDPKTCAQPTPPKDVGNGTLVLNAVTTSWSCSLLAGRAKASSDATSTDYALVVTSPDTGALTNKSGRGVTVSGSVYLNGPVDNKNDLQKPITVAGGDVVSPSSRPTCTADLAALSQMPVDSNRLKTCTEQTLAQALPTVNVGSSPAFNASTTYGSGVSFNMGAGAKCQVFFPGRYTAPPNLVNGSNYFVSGLYYLDNVGNWTITGNQMQVTGGHRALSTDTPALPGDCSMMTDALALTAAALSAADKASITGLTYSSGVTWVLGGRSVLDMRRGDISLYSPPRGSSSQPMSLVGFASATNGFAAMSSTAGSLDFLTGFSNNTHLFVNGKIYAPEGKVTIFSTNDTDAAARGGIVGYKIDLQASAAGGDSLAISSSGGSGDPPPPFRTIKITSSVAGNTALNTAVATVSNFLPYTVLTKSWRTS